MSPRVFFTSDTHFGHKGILKYCKDTRPYATVREHDEALIENWNKTVTRNSDIVYHLGDFAWHNRGDDPEYTAEKILTRLNGKKYLIAGNHDQKEIRKLNWAGVSWAERIKISGIFIYMSHYPVMGFRENAHLHGHTHGNSQYRNRVFDVGVDVYPNMLSLEELLEVIKPLPLAEKY